MELPVNPPILPMLAKRVSELLTGGSWMFGPKWDGFRALVFRDGDEIFIQSRDEKPLGRYFPVLPQGNLRRRCHANLARYLYSVQKAQRGLLDMVTKADGEGLFWFDDDYRSNTSVSIIFGG